MNKFFYLLLIVPFTANAQINIYNISLTDSTKQVLYVGIDNKIKITGDNIEKFAKSIVGGGGILTRLESDLFLVRANKSGDTAIIKLSSKNKIIAQKKFKVESVPDIVAAIGYMNDSIASIQRILSNPYMTAGCQCYLKLNVAILGFNMAVKSIDKEEITLSSEMNRFSEEQIKTIKECRPGDKLHFQKIRATGPDGRARYLKPFSITIK